MSVPSCTAKDLTPVNLHVFSNERPLPHRRSSFFQEPAHFPNDQRLVPQEHVVVRFLQLDVCAFFTPCGENADAGLACHSDIDLKFRSNTSCLARSRSR